MREQPRLANETIMAELHAHYGISATELVFLPLGNDSDSFVYRVHTAEGALYFLKVRAARGFSLPSLVVPSFLHGDGVPHIAAPIPTVVRALWVSVQDFAISLYPFISGQTGAEVSLGQAHWREFGALIKQVHTYPLRPDLLQIIPRERFIPSRRNVITDLEATIDRQTVCTPEGREFAATWLARRAEIDTLVERADTLGCQLRQTAPPLSLCHADMRARNLLLGSGGELWLIDWEETILAPKERDLMFVAGGAGGDQAGPHESAAFFEGYGDAAIDPAALAYYRLARAVQEIALYGEQILLRPQLQEQTRREAVDSFMSLFAPGNAVSAALASEFPTVC